MFSVFERAIRCLLLQWPNDRFVLASVDFLMAILRPTKLQNHMPSRTVVWASARHHLLLNHRSPVCVISRLHRLCFTGARLTLVTCPTQPSMYCTQIPTSHEYFVQVSTGLYIPYSRVFRSTVSSTANLPQITQTYPALRCLAHTPSKTRHQPVYLMAFERSRKTSHA